MRRYYKQGGSECETCSLIWRILLKDTVKMDSVAMFLAPRYRTWAVVAVRCKMGNCSLKV
jgi:hypothetical protein